MQLYLREALDNLAGDGLSPIGFAAGGELGAALILDAEMAGADADFLRAVASLLVGLAAVAVFLPVFVCVGIIVVLYVAIIAALVGSHPHANA